MIIIEIIKFDIIINKALVALEDPGSFENGFGWINPFIISCCERISFAWLKKFNDISIPIIEIATDQKKIMAKIKYINIFLLLIKIKIRNGIKDIKIKKPCTFFGFWMK